MPRTYTLKRRAEHQAETRQRIVQATFDLHASVGPARTTVSMIAERAGVQRHTLYAYFPDDRSLFLACSGFACERDPPPDAAGWRTIKDRCERLRTGLRAVYGWYERNAELTASTLSDAEHHVLTREMIDLRFASSMAAWHDVLGVKMNVHQRALLRLALSFFTWRTLVRENGLTATAAAEVMLNAIACD